MREDSATIVARVLQGHLPDHEQALRLAAEDDLPALMEAARTLRDAGFGSLVTYSRKVFIPLTHLCRDVCHYCTFATTPRHIESAYLPIEEVVKIARAGADAGCREALFTLGEKPELRYRAAREALAAMGFETTIDYLEAAARAVFEETGLLPHLNPGNMTPDEMARLRAVSASMGIMLESTSDRLTEKGMPHHGSPDKVPAVRLQTLDDAGAAAIPFTSGILIGIGETRTERVESLLAIRDLHDKWGHVQEIIVQNFRAKANTKMAMAPEPDLEEMLWTLAVARIVFGASMSLQAPPNLSPGVLPKLVDAGLNDWGGVSPVTPDHVNPEAPWPHLDKLARETAVAGKLLHERLTIYPAYARHHERWLDPALHTAVLKLIDADGFPRTDAWTPGAELEPPRAVLDAIGGPWDTARVGADLTAILAKASAGEDLDEAEVVRLFRARGEEFTAVCATADALRRADKGDTVTFVVNRNINYTNVCYFKCQFCAFSKGKLSENLRGRPYDLDDDEIRRRVAEAWDRGATEVCMQGGIHPEYTGQTYLDIVRTVKGERPDMHVHAFSPLEVWQGAATLGLPLKDYLQQLKDAGLDTLPGTAAEVLDDEVRATLCPDKINTAQWLEVMETAHEVGFNTTATIMYGHVDRLEHWARHLLRIRTLQQRTGGFTEFVPLPFVHMEAPLYLKGHARKGPTFREAVLMHAVARLTLHPHITNIQASWVKMGHAGVQACLNSGCNDLGGTLMNETITRAAGAAHGQETSPERMAAMIRELGREPLQRSTAYGAVSDERRAAGSRAGDLIPVINTPARKYERKRRAPLIRPGLDDGSGALPARAAATRGALALAGASGVAEARDLPDADAAVEYVDFVHV
ncbi:MAG TPA: 5-amino-6-(D-ribitylamino)uracil--L-tyrosine 4-hydroxyphenyl transferase CofH [Pseudomonadales bacterium]|nr:5-amino-6-(D-ribitylamino)uracil--L-tyrosine 4-hydroxyphenyl transferase CofH [Pseudomonadales bacterium]